VGECETRFGTHPVQVVHEWNTALWPSERAPRIGLAQIDARFAALHTTLGLAPGLDFHSLRRSYVTHLIEAGWDPLFVQHQVGHEHASTTEIYTCVSSDFRTRTPRRALDAALTQAVTPAAGPAAATIGPQPAGSSR
jgi:site-specific recombinase XerC